MTRPTPATRQPALISARSSALAVSALVIATAALSFDAGRTAGRASCLPTQPALTCAIR